MDRSQAADIMVALDFVGGLVVVYIGVMITHAENYMTLRGAMRMLHKVALVGIAAALEWHAYDIWSAPEAHGLAGSNFLLHSCVVVGLIVSGVLHILKQVDAKKANVPYTNGHVLFGPSQPRR